jgi:hypothetical protein
MNAGSEAHHPSPSDDQPWPQNEVELPRSTRESLDSAKPFIGTFSFDEVEALLIRQNAEVNARDSFRKLECDALSLELLKAKEQVKVLEAELSTILSSSWWRIGTPVRSLSDRVKRRIRKP